MPAPGVGGDVPINGEAGPDEASRVMVLGTATIGNLGAPMLDEDAYQVVHGALDLGVTSFDTAPLYGLGLAERRLGVALRGVPRDSYRLSTKVGRVLVEEPHATGDQWAGFHTASHLRPRWDFSTNGVRRSIEQSFERLETAQVELALLHDPDLSGDADAVPRGLEALDMLRADGLVQRIGVASKDIRALERALDFGGADVLMIPGRLTLINREASAIALRAEASGVAIWNAAPFNGGALAGAPLRASGYGALSDAEAAAFARVLSLAAEFDVPVAPAALQYAARLPAVERLTVGAASASQIADNLAGLRMPLPAVFWERLDAMLESDA
jgi:D-threo-aldose 1-dehydrogenase